MCAFSFYPNNLSNLTFSVLLQTTETVRGSAWCGILTVTLARFRPGGNYHMQDVRARKFRTGQCSLS